MRSLAERQRLKRKPLRFLEPATKERSARSREPGNPEPDPLPALLGKCAERIHLDVGRREIGDLQKVGPAKPAPTERHLAIARSLGELHDLASQREALTRGVGSPYRDMARCERVGERAGVTEPACNLDGQAAQLVAPLGSIRKVELGRKARREPHPYGHIRNPVRAYGEQTLDRYLVIAMADWIYALAEDYARRAGRRPFRPGPWIWR